MLKSEDFKPGTLYQIKEGFDDGTIKTKSEYYNAKWVDKTFNEADRPKVESMLNGVNTKAGLCGIRLKDLNYGGSHGRSA